MMPIYKGTFERGDGLKSDYPDMTSFYRDHVIMWSKDLGRSIDYLETRRDIDAGRLAYFGVSWGAALGSVLPAVEKRIDVAILHGGGFYMQRCLPEVDQLNFAPRVTIPVLMLNGRYDNLYPVDTSQIPMFQLLATQERHKAHILYDSGHTPPRQEIIKETLNWLDRYLGPVDQAPTGPGSSSD